jgi:uncharacterized protein YkwD
MRTWGVVAIVAIALLAPATTAGAATCADASLAVSASNTSKVEAALRCLVNQERAKRGRKALKSSSTLNKLALDHSKDMDRRHYFSHETPAGTTAKQRVDRSSYKGTYVAENIGRGGTSAEAMMAVWMKSKQHRENILSSKATQIGAGVVASGPLYTLVFAKGA